MRSTLIVITIAVLFANAAVARTPAIKPSAGAPARIISLKPNITEIVYALGMGERLVGVTRYCDTSQGKVRPQIVADYSQPYTERIIALDPGIILGSEENSSRRSVENLKRIGMHVELFQFATIGDTISSMRGIGNALGYPAKGEELAARMESELKNLNAKWKDRPLKNILIVWGTRPIVVAGAGTYMDELLSYIAARNVVRETKIKYPRIGIEEMIAMEPDVIVDLSMGSEVEDARRTTHDARRLKWRPWDGITAIKAVREGRMITMNAGEFRAGPNIPSSLEKLAKLIH